jgi:hypothetical protein
MATTATLEEFKIFSGYRNLSPEEEEQLQVLLQQAARQITSFLGTSNWSIPANPLTGLESDGGSIAKDTQLYMVKRYYDNQEGLVSESFDGYSVSLDSRAGLGIRLTLEDKQALSQHRKSSSKIQTKPLHRNFGNVW